MRGLRSLFLIVIVALIFFGCKEKRNTATLAFYNVENLFDTIDAPDKPDEEFLPGSAKGWNTARYEKKLNDIAKVIHSIDTIHHPAILGVCEVENRLVLEDLVATQQLAKTPYQIVHVESPDYRGIDNALLFDKSMFSLRNYQAIPVVFDENYTTRDILYVALKVDDELFHVYVNHWPSRRGGESVSEFRRVKAASVLKAHCDSILSVDQSAKIVIMGDMNDEPANKSIYEVLAATDDRSSDLYNLMSDNKAKGEGSYNYRGNWNMLDNIIVSNSMLNSKGFTTNYANGYVFRLPFMEFENDQGIVYPSRTYGGPNYYGGISDHFPVYFTIHR